ncbi:hypothetical protein BD408DRAFT_406488 [Parasitella parasitica]|nr:hypothetical protein BD408DRAFT_406488 [Parasitella parasitica]
MADWERAMNSYEAALRHNPYSITALSHIASLCRGREQFAKAVEYFKRILALQENNGETWSALGHCYLMMDNLQEAYQAYQQALYHLQSPKDPKLWYGIGILYDRYGSIEHAEEAFSAVMKMDPQFEKSNEIYFRLGIIYKQQQKYDLSLQCFRYILHNPPRPLTEIDIWFQTGHVYEQQKEHELAKEAYERVLSENPDHAKVLQQLGWLFHQQNTSFSNQPTAIQYLTRSLKADSTDAQSWYLLGRCYMVEQNYNKAYEAYQQAVYRDARNPTFWCSIGVLYYQINQYRDALDAYSRAIRLNPYISEVWYDLGTLYESCNNQIQDALDAYQRASELDPSNPHIRQRLDLLRKSNPGNAPVSTPVPQDVNNPYQYQNGPNSNNNSQYPPPPPLVPGPQSGETGNGSPQYPHHPFNGTRNYEHTRMASDGPQKVPRDLPLPPPTGSQGTGDRRRSPIPYGPLNNSNNMHGGNNNNSNIHNADVRIPDIGGGGRAPAPSERVLMNPMLESRSPIYRHSTSNTKMGSVARSPIPSKTSPKYQTPYYSPRQHHPHQPQMNTVNTSAFSGHSTPIEPYQSYHLENEPLRRTSVLYDNEKNNAPPLSSTPPPSAMKREYIDNSGGNRLSGVNKHPRSHHRHSSSSSSSHHSIRQQIKNQSPVENNAADTLMSMSQKSYVNDSVSKKRGLEMADDEEEEEDNQQEQDKRQRIDRVVENTQTRHSSSVNATKDGSISVSS